MQDNIPKRSHNEAPQHSWTQPTHTPIRGTAYLYAYLLLALAWFPLMSAQGLQAQASPGASPYEVSSTNRITAPINEQQRVLLQGQVHPLARPEFDKGAAPADFALERMILTMRGNPKQEAALDALVDAQRSSTSSLYHKWLTPEEFGERFGVSQSDLATIASWLQGHGFQVEEVKADRRNIIFSGTAAQVQSAFQTSIHLYKVNGMLHHANATAPGIPVALSPVVVGVVSMHDFFSTPQHAIGPAPDFDSTGSNGPHYLTPGDMAVIYNVTPLYSQGVDGNGQSIAVVGRADISLADIRAFRKSYGLPAKDPAVIHPAGSPGMTSSADAMEAALDVEWAGALAKKATIKYVPAASTSTTDGVFLSAEYIVNNNIAPVVTVSFGVCERSLGTAANKFMSTLWQQAAVQGMSVFVAASDSGAAGCDSPTLAKATGGEAVNGLCSTPYNVCVGGTEFNDTANPSYYWSASNAAGSLASALSYIPEIAWNESKTNGLYATGGGASSIYAKPAWQSGQGVPKDKLRDIPDIALTSAFHDGYLIYFNGRLATVGGTSLASPSMASIMALLIQHTEEPQGNPDSRLYTLANSQRLGGAAVFHDIVTGNNSVPGVTGFAAGKGYDQVTGLGSVDAHLLVSHWGDPADETGGDQLGLALALSIAAAPVSTQSIVAGHSGAVITVTSTITPSDSDTVALSVTGLPAGVTAVFGTPSLPAPGSGTSLLTLSVAATTLNGVYPLLVTGTPGVTTNTTATAPLSLTVAGGDFLNITGPTAQSAAEGATAIFAVTATGLPAKYTYQWYSQAPGGAAAAITTGIAASYTTPVATLSQDQTAYWVVVSNGAVSVTSATVYLSVTPKPPVITAQPVNQTVILNPLNQTGPTNAIFVVGDNGEPGTAYQWQQCGPSTTATPTATLCAAAGTGWANVASNGNMNSYNTGTLTSAANGAYYRVLLTDTLCNPKIQGATSVVSASAIVTVQWAGGSAPLAKSVVEGTTATFTTVATGNPATTFTYQWYMLPPGAGHHLEQILGATTASYTTPATTISMSGTMYSVVVSNVATSWTSTPVALTVTPGLPVILTQPSSPLPVVANGTNTATFTVVADTLHPGTTYQWMKKLATATKFTIAPGTNNLATYTTIPVAYTDNQAQYEVLLTDTASGNSFTTASAFTTSAVATLTVNYVNIGTQPNSPSSADGKSATFTAVATGNPAALTYQWYAGTSPNGIPIATATAASLTLPAVTNSQNGATFYIVVANSATSTTSNPGTLAVTPPGPSIVDQPQNQSALVGQTATFLVVPVAEPSAPPITYVWQSSPDNKNWTTIPLQTTASYTTPPVGIVNNGTFYHVILTDTKGNVTSNAATLSVNYITINTQPIAVTAQQFTPVTFLVRAVGNPGLEYQWYSQPSTGGGFTQITNAIHSSYTIPSAALGQDGTQFYVCVFNAAIPCSVSTQSSTVTLNVTSASPAAPAITSQPGQQTTATSSATFTVGATGVPVPTFVWQYSTNSGGTWSNVTNALGTAVTTGTTNLTNTLTLTGLSGTNDQTLFQVLLNNTKGSAASNTALLSVKHITVPPVGLSINMGQTASFTVTSTATPTLWQWQVLKTSSTWTNVSEASGATSNYTSAALDSTFDQAQYRVQITYGVMGVVTSTPVTLRVNYITTQPLPQTANTGGTANFTVSPIGTPTAYQWQVFKVNGSWQNVGEASGLSANYTTGMLDYTYDQALYRVLITYGSAGTINSSSALLSVNYISQQPLSKTVDTGATPTLTVTNTGAQTGYQWQKSTDGGATWHVVTEGSGAQTSSFITGPLTSAYSGAQFEVVISFGVLGTVTSNPATVTVNSISSQPTNQTANTGGAATFTVAATGSPNGYQWSRSPDGVNWTAITPATSKSYTTGKLSSADDGAYFQCVASYGSLGSITSSTVQLSVNYITTQPSPTSANQGASVTLTVAANNPPTGYQWLISQNHGIGWSEIAGATNASYPRSSLVQADDEDLFAVILTYPQGQITSDAIMLSVNYISTQPNSPATIPAATANFFVAASGSPTYQWQVNSGSGWGNVSTSDGSTGYNTNMYTTGTLTSSYDHYTYRVLVTYSTGTITSNPGTLTVKFLTIGTAPQNATIVSGTTNTFTVAATGTAGVTLHYQWHSQPFGGSAVTVGTDSSSYTTAATVNTDDQTTVWVVVSDSGLCTAVTSTPVATLTVQPVPTIGTQPTTPAIANVGDTPTLSVTAANGSSYSWEYCAYGTDCSSELNWTAISNTNSASYQLPSVVAFNDQTQYHVIISNGLGGITSTPVTLTVSYVTINAFLADAEVTAGQPVIFVVTAVGTHGTTLTYVWHVVAAGQAVGSGGDQVIPGQTLSAYEILSADSSIDGEMIYVVVSNGLGGTGVATSEPVTLLVD